MNSVIQMSQAMHEQDIVAKDNELRRVILKFCHLNSMSKGSLLTLFLVYNPARQYDYNASKQDRIIRVNACQMSQREGQRIWNANEAYGRSQSLDVFKSTYPTPGTFLPYRLIPVLSGIFFILRSPIRNLKHLKLLLPRRLPRVFFHHAHRRQNRVDPWLLKSKTAFLPSRRSHNSPQKTAPIPMTTNLSVP